MDDLFAIVIFPLCMAAIVFALMSAGAEDNDNSREHAACSTFKNNKITEMPARCVKVYMK